MVQYQARAVIKLLKANGFEQVRVSGDHHRFTDGQGHYVTLAYSKLKDNIPVKTYHTILKQAGLR